MIKKVLRERERERERERKERKKGRKGERERGTIPCMLLLYRIRSSCRLLIVLKTLA